MQSNGQPTNWAKNRDPQLVVTEFVNPVYYYYYYYSGNKLRVVVSAQVIISLCIYFHEELLWPRKFVVHRPNYCFIIQISNA